MGLLLLLLLLPKSLAPLHGVGLRLRAALAIVWYVMHDCVKPDVHLVHPVVQTRQTCRDKAKSVGSSGGKLILGLALNKLEDVRATAGLD